MTSENRCVRCHQPRPDLFPPEPAWGEVKGPLCARCWSLYAEARDRRSYVDWDDAFDNASDDEIARGLQDLDGGTS